MRIYILRYGFQRWYSQIAPRHFIWQSDVLTDLYPLAYYLLSESPAGVTFEDCLVEVKQSIMDTATWIDVSEALAALASDMLLALERLQAVARSKDVLTEDDNYVLEDASELIVLGKQAVGKKGV